MVVLLVLNRAPKPTTTDAPASAQLTPATAPTGVAVLASTVDARWGDGSDAWSPGAVLEPGAVLKLTSGAAQVEFYSGARIILRGPAVLELKSDMEARCRSGEITAHVPLPARGFKITTDRLSVVDLGTEFGLIIPPTGLPEVHVFSGEVELRQADHLKPVVKLTTGQAGQLKDGSIHRVPAAPQSFLREAEYGQLADGDIQRRRAVWQKSVISLSNDRTTLVHYKFPDDQFRIRTITNLALASPGAGSSASIVGCSSADGRWPLSRAIEFQGPGDRVRLEVAGSFTAVTLLVWTRFDTLPNTYHALIAPDGLAEGTLRWGLTGDGELRLGIARRSGKAEPNWEVIMTPPVMTPERLGHWVLFASTFDGKMIRHYVDGKLVKAGDAFTAVPVLIGAAEIGNWRGPTRRFFRGRMDELAILSRAMTAQELKDLYESGRPVDSSASNR